jgi:hypothetical protein
LALKPASSAELASQPTIAAGGGGGGGGGGGEV